MATIGHFVTALLSDAILDKKDHVKNQFAYQLFARIFADRDFQGHEIIHDLARRSLPLSIDQGYTGEYMKFRSEHITEIIKNG